MAQRVQRMAPLNKIEPKATLDRLAYNVTEVAEVISVGPDLMSALIQSGQVAVVRCGRRVIIPRRSLEAFLAQAQPQNESAQSLQRLNAQ